MKEETAIKSISDLVAYEVCNSWWAGLFSDDKTQEKIAKYYVRKVKAKLKKYKYFMDRYNNKIRP